MHPKFFAEDNPRALAGTEWVAISTGASKEEEGGHFYWHYREFFSPTETNTAAGGWLIGSKGIGGTRSVSLFSRRAHARRFKVGLQTFFDSNFRGVRRALKRLVPGESGFVRIYEGSLADLCLILYLAPRLRTTTFFFNFFWPRQWIHLVRRHRRLWRLMRRVVQNSAPNIVLLADTPKYAALMSRITGCQIDPFPVFTPFKFAPVSPLRKRTVDVLIAVKRPEDWLYAQNVLLALPSGISLKIAVTGPESVLQKLAHQELTEVFDLKILNATLPAQTFVELLNSTKVVFLAYLKEHYELGSSGKLVEACQAGCSVLVPQDSGLSSQIKDTDPETWSTFSRSEPHVAAKNIVRLLRVFPKPMQRLHSQEQAMVYFEQKHWQRLQAAPHDSAGTTNQWMWIVALALGSLFSIATYWEHPNVVSRFRRLLDRILGLSQSFAKKQRD